MGHHRTAAHADDGGGATATSLGDMADHAEGTLPQQSSPEHAKRALPAEQTPQAPADPAERALRTQRGNRGQRGMWSDLNLNGPVPARVRPTIGEWGPQGLPSTKHKKRARWLAVVFFAIAIAAIVLTGWYFWRIYR